jgi:iron(III) transport system substrate-binding protein
MHSLHKGGIAAIIAFAATLLPAAPGAVAAGVVNVYSYREAALIEPLLKAFEAKTGIKVNTVYGKDGLIERIAAEGRNSPADVLLTNEFALLLAARDAGITQGIKTPVVEANIPAEYRDPEGHWFGLTRRARVVYASKERVKQDAISYEELADPKWKGKICSRSGQYTYNTSLIASIIAHKGEAYAEKWLKAVKENLAQKPSGGDRDQAKFIYEGRCDIGIGNTYYMGAMMKNEKKPEEQKWAASIKLLFPNAAERGAHVNISGAAITKNAPNKASAIKLVEFLAGVEAQQTYAAANNEYPVRPDVAPSKIVQSWGELKADKIPLADWARFRKKASELVDKVGFDNGPSS